MLDKPVEREASVQVALGRPGARVRVRARALQELGKHKAAAEPERPVECFEGDFVDSQKQILLSTDPAIGCCLSWSLVCVGIDCR